MNKTKRHALTLVEIMLSIVLIGVIGGALAYNLSGAMNRGREFKTKEIKKKLDTALGLALIEYEITGIDSVHWKNFVTGSSLIKTPKDGVYRDGWNNEFSFDAEHNVVYSTRIDTEGNIISIPSKSK